VNGTQCFVVGLLLAGAATEPVVGQGRALVLLTYGGYQIPAASLSDQKDALGPAWTAGGGLGLQLNSNLVLRGLVSLAKSDYEGPGLILVEQGFRRIFATLDLQVGLPTSSSWAPYVFAGAGWIRVSPADMTLQDFGNLVTRFGAGTNYVIDNTFLTVFAEVGNTLYRFNELGFNSYQYDVQISGGIAYAFPF
jgi:hypothetical protein